MTRVESCCDVLIQSDTVVGEVGQVGETGEAGAVDATAGPSNRSLLSTIAAGSVGVSVTCQNT